MGEVIHYEDEAEEIPDSFIGGIWLDHAPGLIDFRMCSN